MEETQPEPLGPRSTANRAIVVLTLVMLGLPLPATIAGMLAPNARFVRALAEPQLVDVKPPPPPLSLSLDSWKTGDFQRYFEPWFSSALLPRAPVVRFTNQLYYSLFRRSYMDGQRLVVGRDEALFEIEYIKAYCEPHRAELARHLEPLASGFGELTRLLARHRRPLVFVVTPSKATTMPESLPRGTCGVQSGSDMGARTLVKLLQEHGVLVVDGTALVRDMKAREPVSPFPRGGIHWSALAGKRAARSVVEGLEHASGVDLGELELNAPEWHGRPTSRETDLAVLLNLRKPPLEYDTALATLRCRKTPAGQVTNLVAVGGSFLTVVLDALSSCELFKEVSLYFYYTQFRFTWPNVLAPVDREALHWNEIFGEPSAVVVELNESLIETDAKHLHEFLRDALVQLRR